VFFPVNYDRIGKGLRIADVKITPHFFLTQNKNKSQNATREVSEKILTCV